MRKLRAARERAADAPHEAAREVVAIRLAAHLDAGCGRQLDLLRELARADQVELEIRLAGAQAVVRARGRQLRHHAQRRGVAVRVGLRGDVELRADIGIADAGAPALVDQVILRLTVSRHRHQVGVDAAGAERAEDLDAIGRAEREHAADVGDVAESFAAIEIDELDAATPSALRQRVAERHEPDAGVAEDGVPSRSAFLRQRRRATQQAER